MAVGKNYYLRRKMRSLVEFDLVARSAHAVLERSFGENVDGLIGETRREFEHLLPQLPYIGGKQPFTEFIIFTGMLLAVYRVSKTQGLSVEETGVLIFEIGRSFLCSSPALLLRLFGPMNYSERYLTRLQARAIESHERKYPEDYVYNFVAGDGKTFDYGVDYVECASCKFLAKQNAVELAPYLCPVDILYSEALGWGLTRTTTLAEGAEKCDFRFKRRGPTNIAVPSALHQIVHQK